MQTRKAVNADQSQLKDSVQASLEATYGGLWSSAPLSVWDEDWTSARIACVDDRIVGVGLTRDDVRKFYASHGWTEVRIYPHETIPLNTVDMEKAADW